MYGLSNETIKEVIMIKEKYNINLVIFGSRARGNNRENSDIDIAVIDKVTEELKYKIMDDFDKINIAQKIDLVFIQNINNKVFKETILKEGKKI